MMRVRSLALLAGLSGTAVNAQQSKHAVGGEHAANVSRVMERWQRTWNRSSDTSAMWSMLADSVALYGIGQPKVGTEAVRGWLRPQAAADTLLRLHTIYENVSGDQGYSMGRWTLYTRNAQRITGVHTFVLRRAPDGSWKIRQMLIVPDPAPPGKPSK